jgi:hypothetical protein
MSALTCVCGCEQGGDCTKTTMCSLQNAVQDAVDERDNRIEELESALITAERDWEDERRHVRELEARAVQLKLDCHGQAQAKIQLGILLAEEKAFSRKLMEALG